MYSKLALFDVDGTLIYSNHLGSRSMIQAVESYFGKDIDTSKSMAGKTDRQIVYEMLQHRMTPDQINESWPSFREIYIDILDKNYKNSDTAGVYEGIIQIIEHLDREKTLIGLLTGNIELGAKIKLERLGLWKYFSFGGFAEDGFYRNEIPPRVLKRAEGIAGHSFSPENTFIIGDTPNDVKAGKVIHAKTIVLLTNKNLSDAVYEEGPDYVFHFPWDYREIIKAFN